jgi:hypothetical protein
MVSNPIRGDGETNSEPKTTNTGAEHAALLEAEREAQLVALKAATLLPAEKAKIEAEVAQLEAEKAQREQDLRADLEKQLKAFNGGQSWRSKLSKFLQEKAKKLFGQSVVDLRADVFKAFAALLGQKDLFSDRSKELADECFKVVDTWQDAKERNGASAVAAKRLLVLLLWDLQYSNIQDHIYDRQTLLELSRSNSKLLLLLQKQRAPLTPEQLDLDQELQRRLKRYQSKRVLESREGACSQDS